MIFNLIKNLQKNLGKRYKL